MNAKTVFVGLSGGVDSAVAALRLQRAGYRVVGVFIKVWHPDWLVCNWEQERLDAMRVAAKLDIPFLTCDAVSTYRDEVAQTFIAEYQAGRTPNPDVLCNQQVKFGAFLDFALAQGADLIATGHYAQKLGNTKTPELHRGVDANKDQSYFLWSLSQRQLEHTLFPVGNTPKVQIRQEAVAAGLPTASKKDSQGICFLGQVDIKDFLGHYINLTPGMVINQDGQVVGEHQGALIYTVGQRHGFTISTKNASRQTHYVVDRDIAANTITVNVERPVTALGTTIALSKVITREELRVGQVVTFQTRYRQTANIGTITALSGTTGTATIVPTDSMEAPAPGQSCVLYDSTRCLGGGIIAV